MTFTQIYNDIKSLKIQGAEAIAKAGLKAIKLKSDKDSIKKIMEVRPTEPALRNAIKFSQISSINNALTHFTLSEKIIPKIGAKKIHSKKIIFTHCHSSTVVSILKEAKSQKKNFIVHNTETRPMLQGRKTAKELSKAGIEVHHFVDSGARLALKKADLMLIGCDAITAEGKVINKIGSEMMAEIAERHDTPVYVCTDSWKFDPLTSFGFDVEIEKRNSKEIWKNPPKKVKIFNYAFEKINPDLISGIISELGVHSPNNFVREVTKAYPWMLK